VSGERLHVKSLKRTLQGLSAESLLEGFFRLFDVRAETTLGIDVFNVVVESIINSIEICLPIKLCGVFIVFKVGT